MSARVLKLSAALLVYGVTVAAGAALCCLGSTAFAAAEPDDRFVPADSALSWEDAEGKPLVDAARAAELAALVVRCENARVKPARLVSYTDRESLELKIAGRRAWLVRFERVPLQFGHRREEKRAEIALTCAIDFCRPGGRNRGLIHPNPRGFARGVHRFR